METARENLSNRYDLIDEHCEHFCDIGDGYDLGDFYADNDFDAGVVNAVGELEPGGTVAIGGGAAPLLFIRRVS